MSASIADRVSVTSNPTFWEMFVASLVLLRYCWRLLFLHAIFPLFGIFLLLTPFITGDRLGVVEVLLAVVTFSFTPLTTALAIWLARRRNKLAQGPFMYSFDSEGMHTAGEAFNMTIHWSAIPRIRRSRRFLFIFISPSRAHCIPLRLISDPGFFEQLRTFASERVDF